MAGAANDNKTIAVHSETILDQTKPEGLLPAATDSAAASPLLAIVEGAPDTATPSPTPALAAEVSDETKPPTDSTTATGNSQINLFLILMQKSLEKVFYTTMLSLYAVGQMDNIPYSVHFLWCTRETDLNLIT